MGIRFLCHHCDNELHVKDFLAGKVGKCPSCSGRFRVPMESAEYSLSVERIQSADNAVGESPKPAFLASSKSVNTSVVETKSTAEAKVVRNAESVETLSSDEASSSSAKEANQSHSDELRLESANQLGQPNVPPFVQPKASAVPKAFLDSINTWYMRSAIGGQYGPTSTETMKQWLGEGRITADSYLWREGWVDWLAAHDVLSDYFVDQASPSLATDTENPPAVQNAVATVVVTKAYVKKTRRKQFQLILIIGLSILFLALVAALVIVLINRS